MTLQLVSTQLDRFVAATVVSAVLLGAAIAQLKLVVVAAAIALVLVAVLPVEVSLGTFAFLVPFDYVLVIGHHDSAIIVTWLAGAFAGAGLLVYGLASGRLKRPPRQAWYWAAFMMWLALSTAWTIDKPSSIARISSVLCIVGLYGVATALRIRPQELSRVLIVVVMGGVVASLVSIHQAAHLGFQDRAALTFGESQANPNEFAFGLLLPFSLAFAGVLSRGSFTKKLMLLVALTCVTAGIFLTMSRGALIALLVTTFTLLFRVGMRKRLLIPLLVVVLPLLFLPNLFYERLDEARSDRGTGRLDIFFVGMEIIKHNPLLGTGMATFPIVYDQYAGYAPVFHGYQWSSHNTYLQAWAEAGVIGFALLLIAIVFQLKKARDALGRAQPGDWSGVAVEAACWGALAFGLSASLEFNKSFWLILILLTLVTQQKQQASIYAS